MADADVPQFPTEYLWKPSTEMVEMANVTRFMKKHGITDREELIERSAKEPEWFWPAALEDLGVEWFKPYNKVYDRSAGNEWTKWFVGGTLNITHNCLDKHLMSNHGRGDKEALVWEGETGGERRFTYAELNRHTDRLANGLKSLGVGVGDTVGLYMPLVPETVMALLACFKVGAMAIPIFSGYAPSAVSQRLVNAEAKVLLTADISTRRGKPLGIVPQAREAALATPSLNYLVVLWRGETADFPPDERYLKNGGAHFEEVNWQELVEVQTDACPCEELEAEAVAMILYTSGTTGMPKGTVHTHGGTLAQVVKELGYHFDLKPSDRFFWLTDIGWMMGPWAIIGTLHHGATLFIFEGAPNFPDEGRLWDMAERHKLTHLCLSPTAIRLLKRSGTDWPAKHDLSTLRMLGSTGEPWDPESYGWFFKHVGGGRCPVINISGGTDIMGCFLTPLPIQPLRSCSLGGPGLGMATDVYNEEGQSVREEVGYLVCTRPGPSMTRGLWKAPEKYIETYWSRWPGIWNHGDWAYVDKEGQWYLLGRADDTLKVAGRRIGPSEIEGALMDHEAVAEAAAVGVPHEIKGTGIACFAVLAPGFEPSEGLRAVLANHVASILGKVDKPDKVLFVTELPKTRSAKILRRVVRDAHLGKADDELGDLSSLERKESVVAVREAT